jgi:hypothetical protein
MNIPCQCCRNQLPINWMWYVCNRCGFRICAHCLNRCGGFKCGQCSFGHMEKKG